MQAVLDKLVFAAAQYPVGSVCEPELIFEEYALSITADPEQTVLKLAFTLSITGLALTVMVTSALVEQPKLLSIAEIV
jgi:hypothetical protein